MIKNNLISKDIKLMQLASQKYFFISAFLILTTMLAGCGGSSGGDEKQTVITQPTTQLSCNAISTDKTSAKPLGLVTFTGITGADEDILYIKVTDDAGNETINALFNAANGAFEMYTPAHPSGSPDGGMSSLVVTDGKNNCPEVALEIMPLQLPAGDPLTELTTALDNLANELMNRLGITRDELLASLDQLPVGLIPLALADELLNSVEFQTAFQNLTADEQRLLLGLLAELDIADTLNQLTADLSANEVLIASKSLSVTAQSTPTPDTPITTSAEIRSSLVATQKIAKSSIGSSCKGLGSVVSGYLGIDTAKELSDHIYDARNANARQGVLAGKISQLNSSFAVLGLVAPNVNLLWGALTYATQLYHQMVANLYPSELTELTYQLEKAKIEEDWDIDKDGDIKWGFAKVWATNKGMSFYRAGIDLITTTTSLPSGFKSTVVNTAASGLDFAGKNALNTRLDQLPQPDPDEENCWVIGSTKFGPVTIDDDTGEKYVFAYITDGESVSLNIADQRKIEPSKLGSSQLKVETQNNVFPGPIVWQEQTVSVERKAVKWIPSTLFIEKPEDSTRIETAKFRIDNAKHFSLNDLDIEPDTGVTLQGEPTGSNGLYTVNFKTPTERSAYPVGIKVTSTSKNLEPVEPARSGDLLITTKTELTITPADICVAAGEEQTFTAEVKNGPPNPVLKWEIISGPGTLAGNTDIDELYTALSSVNGEIVTLRATLEGEDDVDDEISFRVGPCIGVSIAYDLEGTISFPWNNSPDCGSNIDDNFNDDTLTDSEIADTRNKAPASTLWRPGQQHEIDQTIAKVQFCAGATLPGSASNQSRITLSPSGDTVDLDFNLSASAICDIPDGQLCSEADSMSTVAARFEFEIDAAANYLLDVRLNCQSSATSNIPGFSDVIIYVLRFNSLNEVALTNTTDPSKAPGIINKTCGSIDPQLLEFDTPVIQGTADRVTVLVTTGIGAMGNRDKLNENQDDSAFMTGTITVREQD